MPDVTPTSSAPSSAPAVPPPTRPEARVGLPWRTIRFLFKVTTRVAPGIKPAAQNGLVRAGYELVSRYADDTVTCLNYGYASLDGRNSVSLSQEDEPNRYSLQLYHRVAGAVDLRGKDVLEVGCGRGGGASFVLRYLQPRSVTGVDFSAKAIAFCRHRHRIDGLTFVKGDAQDLPCPDSSFDAVLSVESSHSYPSFERFLDEVVRVLRPGGSFLFTDFRAPDQVATLRTQFHAAGLMIRDDERITDNVLRSLQHGSRRRLERAERVPRFARRAFKNFAAVEGTPMFEAFQSGKVEYVRFSLVKGEGG
jgi:ubiquinone/menaquinone biosynthesis C-methylase UbiE